MARYKTVKNPNVNECGYAWWLPKDATKVIQWVEKQNPGWEFVQFVTSPGNGGYPDFIILKNVNPN